MCSGVCNFNFQGAAIWNCFEKCILKIWKSLHILSTILLMIEVNWNFCAYGIWAVEGNNAWSYFKKHELCSYLNLVTGAVLKLTPFLSFRNLILSQSRDWLYRISFCLSEWFSWGVGNTAIKFLLLKFLQLYEIMELVAKTIWKILEWCIPKGKTKER